MERIATRARWRLLRAQEVGGFSGSSICSVLSPSKHEFPTLHTWESDFISIGLSQFQRLTPGKATNIPLPRRGF